MNKPTETHAEVILPAWAIWAFQGTLLSGLVLLVQRAIFPVPKQITVELAQEVAVISVFFMVSLMLVIRSVIVGGISQG